MLAIYSYFEAFFFRFCFGWNSEHLCRVMHLINELNSVFANISLLAALLKIAISQCAFTVEFTYSVSQVVENRSSASSKIGNLSKFGQIDAMRCASNSIQINLSDGHTSTWNGKLFLTLDSPWPPNVLHACVAGRDFDSANCPARSDKSKHTHYLCGSLRVFFSLPLHVRLKLNEINVNSNCDTKCSIISQASLEREQHK